MQRSSSNENPDSEQEPGTEGEDVKPAPAAKTRVLLVDDDPDITRLLSHQLATKGFEGSRSHDCDEAVAALDREHFSVAVVDYALPKQTGASIIEHIHENKLNTAVILLTASMSIMTAVDCTAQGSVFRILTKPVPHDEFLRAVEDAACFAEKFLAARKPDDDEPTAAVG